MSEEEYDMFCTQCGARISKDTAFCPSCGAAVGGEPAPQTYNNGAPSQNYYGPDRSGRLLVLSIICAITAVFFLYMGISTLVQVDSIITQLQADPGWPDMVQAFEDAGISADEVVSTLKSILTVFGVSFLVGGIAAALPAVCGFTKKLWALGLIGCIVVTIFTATTLIGLIVGIIFTYLYATTKPAFN